MNRREFIKKTAGAAGVLAIAPMVSVKAPVRDTGEDYQDWFENNLDWLLNGFWNDCEHVEVGSDEGMQEVYCSRTTDEFWMQGLQQADMEAHITVLRQLVFGQHARIATPFGDRYCSQGFLSLYGRLPRPGDRLTIEWCPKLSCRVEADADCCVAVAKGAFRVVS